jgi:putative transposase
LGLVQTASENKPVIAAFLRELGERGFPLDRRLLVVVDGAKGMRAAVREVLGDVPVQRCQWHKRENVVSYLAKSDQPTWRRKLQAAYAHPAMPMRSAPSTDCIASCAWRTNRPPRVSRKGLRKRSRCTVSMCSPSSA